jgi:hypothetical protein
MEDKSDDTWEAIDRLLAGSLSAAERENLLERIAADADLQQRLAVARALQQRQQQQQQAARTALSRHRQFAGRRRLVALAATIILIGGLFWWRSDRHFFEKEQGIVWLDAAVQAEQDSGYLSIVGGADWRSSLLKAIETGNPAHYDTAARALKELLPARACEKEQLQYYAGLINLLYYRSYNSALRQLECAEQLGFAAERTGFSHWLLLACISARQAEKAVYYQSTYQTDITALPPAARQQFEDWKENHQ